MTQQFTTILAALISPILTAVGAVIVTTWEGRRGKLVYYTNPSIVIVVPLAEHLQHVEMGVVFIENRTRRVIENVVIAHNFHTLYYRIAPAIEMNEVELQGNSKGFKFPRFPARSSVSVYYLFLEPPPGVVLGRIYSDEGNALFSHLRYNVKYRVGSAIYLAF